MKHSSHHRHSQCCTRLYTLKVMEVVGKVQTLPYFHSLTPLANCCIKWQWVLRVTTILIIFTGEGSRFKPATNWQQNIKVTQLLDMKFYFICNTFAHTQMYSVMQPNNNPAWGFIAERAVILDCTVLYSYCICYVYPLYNLWLRSWCSLYKIVQLLFNCIEINNVM